MIMIPCSKARVHTRNSQEACADQTIFIEQENTHWQEALSNSISTPQELLSLLELEPTLLPETIKADKQFALKVPRPFASRMEKGNPEDPLLLQVLPLGKELSKTKGYSLDPLAENKQIPRNGVIHKYYGRLLLITSGICAINCRFCFRRHFPYGKNQLVGENWNNALSYIASDNTIKEVILSGGDPLAASDKRLGKLVSDLSEISHVKTLRIHTRLPIVIPQRITREMLQWLTGSRLKPVVVIHCNHINEIDLSVEAALSKLQQAGVILLNQTVLLKGINDSSEALIALNQKLFHSSVLPYYLHLLDPVQGAAHFDVNDTIAKRLIKTIMAKSPGYLVPRLVREIAGCPCKTPV
ncbi:MAG: EF-P beta-lysylation protein EpmB [Candidatus Endonucleobacter sp. (ex Gigantidas childressi)]|nr:EF-P beta-lysylation protein EpmB [Candidatus Endonucleobacter sp. (ex Gigantidas childressi)]